MFTRIKKKLAETQRLGVTGTLAVVGALEAHAPENDQERAMHRQSVASWLIGTAETQEVLDFCAEHDIELSRYRTSTMPTARS